MAGRKSPSGSAISYSDLSVYSAILFFLAILFGYFLHMNQIAFILVIIWLIVLALFLLGISGRTSYKKATIAVLKGLLAALLVAVVIKLVISLVIAILDSI